MSADTPIEPDPSVCELIKRLLANDNDAQRVEIPKEIRDVIGKGRLGYSRRRLLPQELFSPQSDSQGRRAATPPGSAE